AVVAGPGAARAVDACSAASTRQMPPIVELYTSEGCNSCPPADRWMSTLKADPSVVALAFHVDYWDRLGWKDRFASPAYTQRQAQTQASSGARFNITLVRDAGRFSATVVPASGAPARLAAYWALTENNHSTAVKAGENEG